MPGREVVGGSSSIDPHSHATTKCSGGIFRLSFRRCCRPSVRRYLTTARDRTTGELPACCDSRRSRFVLAALRLLFYPYTFFEKLNRPPPIPHPPEEFQSQDERRQQMLVAYTYRWNSA